jgi:hypothetical protein
VKESSGGASSLRAVPMDELMRFHAELACQIVQVPDGGTIRFQIVD